MKRISLARASAKMFENPKTRTTGTGSDPPAAPATIAKDVRMPSSPPKMRGLRKPPSVWCISAFATTPLFIDERVS